MEEDDALKGGSLAWVGRVRSVVAWLAGAAAGLSALLYAAGFLAVRAHLNMLGLYGFVDPDGNDYLQEGAKFFHVSAVLAGQAVVSVFILGPLFVGLFIAVRSWIDRRAASVGRIGGVVRAWDRWHRGALYGLAFAGLAVWLSVEIRTLTTPLCIENLLYPSRSVARVCEAQGAQARALLTALVSRDEGTLAASYEYVLVVLARFALLWGLAAWASATWARYRQLAVVPFVLATTVVALLVPMNYGILKREALYPRVQVTLSDTSASLPTPPLYLLSHRNGEWVFWSAPDRAVVWMPGSAVARASISTVDDPLQAVTDRRETKP